MHVSKVEHGLGVVLLFGSHAVVGGRSLEVPGGAVPVVVIVPDLDPSRWVA